MSQSTHEKVVMGVINGHCSQTAQIKNNDGRLKTTVSSTDGRQMILFLLILSHALQRLILWRLPKGWWLVVERGFLISEITDLVLNVNPEPLV